MVRSIRESAAQVREIFGSEEEDELLSIEDMAMKCDCSEQSVDNWMKRKLIPYELVGRKRMVRISVADEVRELREEHGRDWANFVSWEVAVKSPPTTLTRRGYSAQSEPEENGDEDENLKVEFVAKMIRRARDLDKSGKREASYEVLWAAIELLGFEEEEQQ